MDGSVPDVSSIVLPERRDSSGGTNASSQAHKQWNANAATVGFQATAKQSNVVENGAENGAAMSESTGAFLYTVGHGHTAEHESSDSDDDEAEIAARAQRRRTTEAADGAALAAWVAGLAGGEGTASLKKSVYPAARLTVT